MVENQIPKGQYCELKISDIILPDNNNPRDSEPQGHLFALKDSFETVGQMEPIIVSKTEGKYYTVCGRRRIEAAKQAGQATIEAKVYDNLDQRTLLLMVGIENILRKDFNAIEKARYIKMLVDEKYHPKAIAARLDMNVDTVNRTLNLLELPDDIQKMITRKDKPLPIHQAQMLHTLPEPMQREAARQIAPVTGPIANEEAAKDIIFRLEEDKLNQETKKLDLRPDLPIPKGQKPPKLKTGKKPKEKPTEKPTSDQKKVVPKGPKADSNSKIVKLGEVSMDLDITAQMSIRSMSGVIKDAGDALVCDDANVFIKVNGQEIVIHSDIAILFKEKDKTTISKIIQALNAKAETKNK